MIKSMCCNADKMYLGKGEGPISNVLGGIYITCCTKCGRLEWCTERENVKYNWYNEKEWVKELAKKGGWQVWNEKQK